MQLRAIRAARSQAARLFRYWMVPRIRRVWWREPSTNPHAPEALPDLEEALHQLEVTAQFLNDLSTHVASDEEKQCCLDAARGFHLAACQQKQTRAEQ
jgi:hypothetical protein